jgi:hypothetical protein
MRQSGRLTIPSGVNPSPSLRTSAMLAVLALALSA